MVLSSTYCHCTISRDVYFSIMHTLIIGQRQCMLRTLDQLFLKMLHSEYAINLGPRQGGHPVAQDGSVAPLEQNSQPAPQVGCRLPFLLSSVP